MSLRRPAVVRPSPDPLLERIQREHELSRAYEAAKTLEDRLELAGWNDERRVVQDIRHRLAAAINEAGL